MRRVLQWLGVAAVLIAVAVGSVSYQGWRSLNQPLRVPASGQILDVPAGTALAVLARQLADAGILEAPRTLIWYARYTGDARRIQAGEYRLTPDLTALRLLRKLSAGDVVMHQLTVVEGWRFEAFLQALRAHPAISAGTESPEEIMTALGEDGVHPEGQFLPDTYLFPKGTRDLDVLRQAHVTLQEVLADAWESRAEALALRTPYEALILASIVEKETALLNERPLISGVFHERLRLGMRLQTDPTVIYGLGSAFDGDLRRRDLTTDTPYNTYTRAGLPPTPIALASPASIAAAVRPEITGALYFVATGDPDGSHYFSRTNEEHNRAVRAYLERQRELTDDEDQ